VRQKLIVEETGYSVSVHFQSYGTALTVRRLVNFAQNLPASNCQALRHLSDGFLVCTVAAILTRATASHLFKK